MHKYSGALLAELGALLDQDRAHHQLSISARDLVGWCLVAQEQVDGAYYARHRLRARWLQRDVLRQYEQAGYVPLEGKYFVAGLRDAVRHLQREARVWVVRSER